MYALGVESVVFFVHAFSSLKISVPLCWRADGYNKNLILSIITYPPEILTGICVLATRFGFLWVSVPWGSEQAIQRRHLRLQMPSFKCARRTVRLVFGLA
jgi:hypothetical protein